LREVARFGGDVSEFVPKAVAERLAQAFEGGDDGRPDGA
jgi:phosphopantetheine adenylyltransferase